MSWRMLWRSAALAAISGLILFALFSFGLLDVGRIAGAFRKRLDLLGLDVGCIAALAGIAIVRHAWALRVLRVSLPLKRVTSANLIGQGLGQWLPGSVLVAEGVRIGILFGSASLPPATKLVRVGMASLGDRLFGFGAIFLVGGGAALALSVSRPEAKALLGTLAAAYFVLGLTLAGVPLLADFSVVRTAARFLSRPGQQGFMGRVTARLGSVLLACGDASADWRRNGVFFVSLALGAVAAALSQLAQELACTAIGVRIPLVVLLAAQPATAIGVIAPLGFAGFGAPQLIAVAVFAAFGVAADAVLTMTLLQSALLLAVQTMLALLAAALLGEASLPARRRPSQPTAGG